MARFRVASFFAGIGGFDKGLQDVGEISPGDPYFKTVFLCEKNKFCQGILKQNFRGVELVSDINNVHAELLPAAEIWCGGFPCQDLSLANQGKRKGLEGSRSGLFHAFAERLDKLRPQWVILENVPGLLNSHDGEDFRIVLNTLGEFGYGVSWRVLDAKYFGTPQRRRRVYIVGSHGNLRSAEVLFEHNATELTPRSGLGPEETTSSGRSASNPGSALYTFQHAGIGRKVSAGPQAKGYRNDGESYTLDSRGSADALCATDDAYGVRDASGFSSELDAARYRALGNAVAVPVITWIGQRIVQVTQKYAGQ